MKNYDNIAKRINNSIRLISFHRLIKYRKENTNWLKLRVWKLVERRRNSRVPACANLTGPRVIEISYT